MKTNIAWPALADEAFNLVKASSTILARCRLTVVNSVLASGSSVASVTLTPELVDTIDADTVVHARIGVAVVNVTLTGLALPAWVADALAVEEAVNARAMHAGVHVA